MRPEGQERGRGRVMSWFKIILPPSGGELCVFSLVEPPSAGLFSLWVDLTTVQLVSSLRDGHYFLLTQSWTDLPSAVSVVSLGSRALGFPHVSWRPSLVSSPCETPRRTRQNRALRSVTNQPHGVHATTGHTRSVPHLPQVGENWSVGARTSSFSCIKDR